MLIQAISLWQPWASLVAIGAKRIETRSWRTGYRGPLAIHAAKAFPKSARELCCEPIFSEALFGPGKHCYTSTLDLPFGAVIATCRLADCLKILKIKNGTVYLEKRHIFSVKENEYAFGDYTPGRFAWILEDVTKLPEPIPAKGFQRLWNWEVPTGLTI